MKNTHQFEVDQPRYQSEARPTRRTRFSSQAEPNYQTAKLLGRCGTPVKFHRPAFFEISNRYFADEEPRGFAIDTLVFGALIATTILPIINSVQAVGTLIHLLGVL